MSDGDGGLAARCGRAPREDENPELEGAPEGWEGTVRRAVCPNCQTTAWYPLCESPVDQDGNRIDPASINEQEWPPGAIQYCKELHR